MNHRDYIAVISQLVVGLLFALLLAILFRTLYRLSSFHPLEHIPGPYRARISSLWLTYHSWYGDEASTVHRLHQRYGKIVRIGPNAVDIADGEALHAIYIEKGGFRKPDYYLNFMINGHRTLFAEIDLAGRAPRAKAVLPMFSHANLKICRPVINKHVKFWIDVMRLNASSGGPVDVLGLARSFTADVLAESLFGIDYGALEKHRAVAGRREPGMGSNMTAFRGDGMADVFDAIGRYWYLPPWAFQWAERLKFKIFTNTAALDTYCVLDNMATKAIAAAVSDKASLRKTYQGRLLEAGSSESETKAECMDALSAGVDNTGLNLAVILFNLVKYPHEYEALRQEIISANSTADDIESLSRLRAVVQEGLRISMANPVRLPRVVPADGWHFQEKYFPAGVEVSCSEFELHNSASVFPSPNEFRPERWLTASKEMYRDHIPFGAGTRRCIAMNLAILQLMCAVYQLVKDDVLAGATCCQEQIDIFEWFTVKVVGGRIDLKWKS